MVNVHLLTTSGSYASVARDAGGTLEWRLALESERPTRLSADVERYQEETTDRRQINWGCIVALILNSVTLIGIVYLLLLL